MELNITIPDELVNAEHHDPRKVAEVVEEAVEEFLDIQSYRKMKEGLQEYVDWSQTKEELLHGSED